MVHLIIVSWFNRSGVWIWNWFRVKLNWKTWSVNLKTTIINGMMINFPHDSWNHRYGVVRIGPRFEVSCWMLADTLSWWFIWFITMKVVGLIRISYKIWWEVFWTTDNAGISLESNYSTALSNILLSCAEICNNWLERLCIIFNGRWRFEMMIELIWIDRCFWGSNRL